MKMDAILRMHDKQIEKGLKVVKKWINIRLLDLKLIILIIIMIVYRKKLPILRTII